MRDDQRAAIAIEGGLCGGEGLIAEVVPAGSAPKGGEVATLARVTTGVPPTTPGERAPLSLRSIAG